MAKSKLPKGSPEQLVVTQPREPGHYCLYNLTGLSLGKVLMLKRLLDQESGNGNAALAGELSANMCGLLVGKEVKPFHATVDPLGHPTPADFE